MEINSVPQTHYTIGTPKRGAENFPCLNPSLLLSKRHKRERLTFQRHSFSEFRNPGVGGFQKAPVNTMQIRCGKCVRVPRRHEEKQSNILLPPGAGKKMCDRAARNVSFTRHSFKEDFLSFEFPLFVQPWVGLLSASSTWILKKTNYYMIIHKWVCDDTLR